MLRKNSLLYRRVSRVRIGSSIRAGAFSPVHSWNTSTNPKLNPEWGMCFFPPDKLTAITLTRNPLFFGTAACLGCLTAACKARYKLKGKSSSSDAPVSE